MSDVEFFIHHEVSLFNSISEVVCLELDNHTDLFCSVIIHCGVHQTFLLWKSMITLTLQRTIDYYLLVVYFFDLVLKEKPLRSELECSTPCRRCIK